MREEFVASVNVDTRCGNIFRSCKPLKSRVIARASERRKKHPRNRNPVVAKMEAVVRKTKGKRGNDGASVHSR